MKKLLILLAVLFFYVFLKSNTIEQKQWREERKNGIEYMRTSYNLNWNNFAEYLKDAYKTGRERILKSRY